MFYC
ncbi:argonaute18b [Zea mays]